MTMLIITLLRIAITLTFLILAAGGPYAVIKLSRFIRKYGFAHEELKRRVAAIEQHLGMAPTDKEDQQ